jgi:hypothetical protein
VGFAVDKAALGKFSPSISVFSLLGIPAIAPHSSSSRGSYNRQVVASVIVGLVPLHKKKKKKEKERKKKEGHSDVYSICGTILTSLGLATRKNCRCSGRDLNLELTE